MITPDLVYEVRRRAGLSQLALAQALGTSQSAIARWERGDVLPSLETVRRIVRACGLELTFRLASFDDSYVANIHELLDLTPERRIEFALEREAFYRQLREAVLSAPRPGNARGTAAI